MSDRLWLLVDDDPDLAFVVRVLLRRRGDSLLHASYVAEAERILASESRSLIVLLDVHLPDLSGIDWLRQRPPQQPVAMFVQSQMNDDLASALEQGATYWMPKEYVIHIEQWNERLQEIIGLESGSITFELGESERSVTISKWWELARQALARPIESSLLAATFLRALRGTSEEELAAWIVERGKGPVAVPGPAVAATNGRKFLYQIACVFGMAVAERLQAALTTRAAPR